MHEKHPNLVYVFADQWRAQALAYAGDSNVQTPRLDQLSRQCINFTTAVANCPVCTPARASLLTGQYPDRHGLFLNDVHLSDDIPTIANALNRAGYDTGWIGKWHIDGHGRSGFIRPEHRKGFSFWHTRECNHNYAKGWYHGEDESRIDWPGYEPEAQTHDACHYLRERAASHSNNGNKGGPFALFLSWGPPHNPYDTAPERYRRLYDPATLMLRPNVPPECEDQARQDLAGYYAHCTALDDLLGQLLDVLDETGLADDTLFVFTSDHGDMLGSQGEQRKQRPYDESILVPFLLRDPRLPDAARKQRIGAPFGTVDIMPTLLDLCGAATPPTVQGTSFVDVIRSENPPPQDAALIAAYSPFGEWTRDQGGRECRGLRTATHTYVRDLQGPWLLFDNAQDPYQMRNLVGDPEAAAIQAQLDEQLNRTLARIGDDFEPGQAYIDRWGYEVNAKGTVEHAP